jgi:hypothetical protein
MFHVLDCHFNNFRFLDSATPFLHVSGWKEPGQISQAIIHPVAPPFLNDAMRLRIAGGFRFLREIGISFFIFTSDGSKIQVPAT